MRFEGPWSSDAHVWNIIRDVKGNEVAEVIGPEPGNARLIAAAPKMHELLQKWAAGAHSLTIFEQLKPLLDYIDGATP